MTDASKPAALLPADAGVAGGDYMTADELWGAAAAKVAWKEYDEAEASANQAAKCCCSGGCSCSAACIDSCDVTTTRGTVVEPCGPPKMCIAPTTVQEIHCTP